MSGIEIPAAVVVLGLVVGLTYGLLAVGLVLVHRATGIVNFAHGQVGVFAATLLVVAVTEIGVPYWLAFAGAVLVASLIGAAVDVLVMRRLTRVPRLMSMVATLGVAQVLLLLGVVVNAEGAAGQVFPQPSLPSLSVGGVHLTPSHVGMLVLVPLVVAGLTAFLRFTRLGIAARAAAANPETARLDGVRAAAMGTMAWALAGAASAVTALLVLPSQGFVTAEALGPGLLVRALVAAVIAQMTRLPTALLAGVAVGVVEQVVAWNVPGSGTVEAVMVVAVVLVLALQRAARGRGTREEAWAAVEGLRPLPAAARALPAVRTIRLVVLPLLLVLAAALPTVTSNRTALVLITIIAYSIVGLSVGVVTGLSGQLTLGQFGLAAVGAVVSFHVTRTTGNFVLGGLLAGGAGALVSTLLGLPALRIRGLMLAVATLAFGLAAQAWLLVQPWAFGSGTDPGYPLVGSFGFDTARRYYWFALPWLVVAVWLARTVRRGALGRRLVAVRDNTDAARAFGVATTGVQLQAFALAGFLAGIGGMVYAHSLSLVSAQAFPVRIGIDLVAMAVIGGVGWLWGPLVGALYVVGIPALLPLDEAGLAATSFGWLLLVMSYPGGIAEIVANVRNRLVARWTPLAEGSRAGADAPAPEGAIGPTAARLAATVAAAGDRHSTGAGAGASEGAGDILVATGLVKRFGGITAVDGVDLTVRRGEVLGLIGPNGAGKTTLFELLGGFERPDAGRIAFEGQDVTTLSASSRAGLGMVRSFQEARLFATLTVTEIVALAHERRDRPRHLAELVGFDRADRRRLSAAAEIVEAMGLGRYRDARVRELSTGTRRIVDLACAVALAPTLLLLDEPSAGVAQRETEALGELIVAIKDMLGATVVIIEHDIPMVTAMADRLVAMESGTVVAVGAPAMVTSHPRVVEAYLGTDTSAIRRSGVPATV